MWSISKMNEQTHVYDICFEVTTDLDAGEIPDDVLMKALKARVKNLEDFGIIGEAVGFVDSYERM